MKNWEDCYDFAWKKSPAFLKIKYIDEFVVGKKVLDVGCGAGFYSKYLLDKGLDVFSIDITKNFNEHVKLQFVFGDGERLPFKDKVFETVLFFDVIEHVEDDIQVLQEVNRVCSRRVIASVPNKDDYPLPKHRLTFKHYKDKTHRREYTLSEVKQLFERASFKIVCVKQEGEISPFLISELLQSRILSFLSKILIFLMLKLGLFNLPKSSIYVVADVKVPPRTV